MLMLVQYPGPFEHALDIRDTSLETRYLARYRLSSLAFYSSKYIHIAVIGVSAV